MEEFRYSEYLKQFKTEIAKEIDIDIDAQQSPTKALPIRIDKDSPYYKGKGKKNKYVE